MVTVPLLVVVLYSITLVWCNSPDKKKNKKVKPPYRIDPDDTEWGTFPMPVLGSSSDEQANSITRQPSGDSLRGREFSSSEMGNRAKPCRKSVTAISDMFTPVGTTPPKTMTKNHRPGGDTAKSPSPESDIVEFIERKFAAFDLKKELEGSDKDHNLEKEPESSNEKELESSDDKDHGDSESPQYPARGSGLARFMSFEPFVSDEVPLDLPDTMAWKILHEQQLDSGDSLNGAIRSDGPTHSIDDLNSDDDLESPRRGLQLNPLLDERLNSAP